MLRIGLGQDSHQIKVCTEKANNPLVLGGIIIDEYIEVMADSDGDMILHSLCNALNTALGKNSFDEYAGPLCKEGITDSKTYLEVALSKIKKAKYAINNVAFSIEAGKPKIGTHYLAIQKKLSSLLNVPEDVVGIAAISGNNLSRYSKGEGIHCFCVVSLIGIDD